MKWSLQLIVLVSLLVAVFFLGKSCNDPCPNATVVHTVDTVYVYKDTVKAKVIPVHTGSHKYNYAAKEAVKDTVPCDSVREYTSSYEDSSLSIIVKNSVLGMMLDSTSIHYKLKVPYTITIHDSTTIYQGVPDTRKSRWYGGLSMKGDRGKVSVAPSIFLSRPKSIVGVGYDPFTSQVHLFGGVRLGRR